VDSSGNAGENGKRSVDCLWMAEESSNRSEHPLVLRRQRPVELLSPLKTGQPGETLDGWRAG
jgi:hypothetical protein